MLNRLMVFFIIGLILGASVSYAKEVSYAQDDRDRLIRVEEGLKAVNQRIDGFERSVNHRIDGLERSVNQRIDGLQNLLYVVISAIFAQIVGVVGFVLWDRRTALAPAIRKTKELEEREELIEKALKEFARIDPRFGDVLRSLKLM